MRALSGVLGACVGLVVGGVAALWFVGVMTQGDDFGDGLALVFLGPMGLLVGLIAGVVCGLKSFDFLRRPDPEGKMRQKRKALCAILFAGLPLVTLFMFHGWQHHDDPPSDASMLAHFAAHRAQFDQLAQMVQHDKGLWRVDQNWTGPDKPQTVHVSPARIADYRRKLTAAGVPRGFQVQDDGAINFLYFLRGCAVCDDTDKDFTYLAKPPEHLLSTLDNCGPDAKGVNAFRHIAGNWYLCRTFIPD